MSEKVSIIVLVHNALGYCRTCFNSLRSTAEVPYEVVAVDNASRMATRLYLMTAFLRGSIHRLGLLDRNTFFAEGNNVGAAMGGRDTSHVLLLNSDVEIRDPLWLRKLLDVHRPGATAYGYVPDGPWPRADGYCLLVDRPVFERYRLDEDFAWWWSVTKLQANLLREGLSVQAVRHHDDVVYHFGGRSGPQPKTAPGMDLDPGVVQEWFGGRNVQVIEKL